MREIEITLVGCTSAKVVAHPENEMDVVYQRLLSSGHFTKNLVRENGHVLITMVSGENWEEFKNKVMSAAVLQKE